jgi:phosphoglycolate phosphatase
VIVSNNSEPAIQSYLAREALESLVLAVAGRDPADAALMKPDPFLVREGLSRANCWSNDAIMIGDSVSDILASQAAMLITIGLANKPGKRDRLEAAGADAVVTSMTSLSFD